MAPTRNFIGPTSRVVLRRLFDAAITLLVIVFLALFGLIMAERGRMRVPAPPLEVAGEALTRTVEYVVRHPTTYFLQRAEQPALHVVATAFARSAGLLLVSMGIATVLGITLGLAMTFSRRRGGSIAMLILSVLGMSTPGFLLAMFFWVLNIQLYRRFDIPALPSVGFGWDLHLVMPALVLAVRPLAQISQVTYVTMTEVLAKDYIRTARAKGLPPRLVVIRHVFPNVALPVITTLGTSLRYSLATLPVVEYFFFWPGVGFLLLEAINLGMTTLAVDLVVCLGLFFLMINMLLDMVYPILDPTLRGGASPEGRYSTSGGGSFRESLAELGQTLVVKWRALRDRLSGAPSVKSELPPLPSVDSAALNSSDDPRRVDAFRQAVRSLIRNPILQISAFLVLALAVLAVFGDRMVDANPYQVHGLLLIDGKSGTPPFPPSSVFPWGTDHIGRDLQALVLSGARQTLTLALFAMVARILLGTALGLLAGWRHRRSLRPPGDRCSRRLGGLPGHPIRHDSDPGSWHPARHVGVYRGHLSCGLG